MGVVYKAFDTKLKRQVALKFLSPVLTRSYDANIRFIDEAQSASALDHQNISTIYEINESKDGRVFISMAYYNGETLSEKISKGQLLIREVIEIAIQIAEGLSKAHQKGIIHKDIKPANIIIAAGGTVKIIDFGLSRLQDHNDTPLPKNTMGTVTYMSPEQIEGKEIDSRTDIWSLAVTIYEMLTSTRPFEGEYDQEIIYSILNEEPEAISKYVPKIPAELERLLRKALAKNPNDRYINIDEFLTELQHLRTVLTSGLNNASDNRDKHLSLAVLPLLNLSIHSEQEYFTDGMTDTLITELAKIRALKVISRTSIMHYKNTEKSLSEIAAELNADILVEGSVLREGSKIQITVQLIDAHKDIHIWAETYERDLQDIFVLQGELVKTITSKIQVNLTQHEKKRYSWNHPINPEPYDNYLTGCFHFCQLSPKHFDVALEYFKLALDHDPKYALAYVGISKVWLSRGYWGMRAPTEAILESKKAVLKALELDDTLEEAHDVLGRIKYFYDWDWDGAEKEFRTAINLNTNYADAH